MRLGKRFEKMLIYFTQHYKTLWNDSTFLQTMGSLGPWF